MLVPFSFFSGAAGLGYWGRGNGAVRLSLRLRCGKSWLGGGRLGRVGLASGLFWERSERVWSVVSLSLARSPRLVGSVS